MESYTLTKPSCIKKRKRVGRGMSSGSGKTSSRGMNGQASRSGFSSSAGFEGGQMPLMRRVPKRGFNNIFKKSYQLVNLEQLSKLTEAEITPELLFDKKLIDDPKKLIKVLSDGELTNSVTITVDAFSAKAKEKIEKSGGKIIIREKG